MFDITEEDAIKFAFDVRPELISAKKAEEAAKMNLRATRREFTPNLGVYGTYQNGIGNDYNVQSGQLGVGLNYNGLNIWRIKKEVDQAKAEYNLGKAKLNLVKAKNVLEVAKVQLSRIMGVPEYTNYELSDQ